MFLLLILLSMICPQILEYLLGHVRLFALGQVPVLGGVGECASQEYPSLGVNMSVFLGTEIG